MALPSPPAVSPIRPTVLHFLVRHLQQGGLEQHSFEMLRDAVRMTNRISHLLFPHSRIFREDARQQIVALCDGIEKICSIFGEHLVMRCNRASNATFSLPNLNPDNGTVFYENMRQWCEVIKTLHEPNRNDSMMYCHILIHFDTYVFAPFLQLHRQEPEHASWKLYGRLNVVRDNFIDLHSICREANKLVMALDREYLEGKRTFDRLATIFVRSVAGTNPAAPPLPESDEAVEALTLVGAALSKLEELDDFFANSDAGSAHSRQSSILDMKRYGICQGKAALSTGRLRSSRSSGVPRVFTGSFDELASSVRQLGLGISKGTPDAQHVEIKDFAMGTPCLLPSPATLLERREALVSRQADWNQRVLAGKSIRSRRPSGKYRALTIDDRTGSLEAWLTAPSPDRAARVLRRQHTL